PAGAADRPDRPGPPGHAHLRRRAVDAGVPDLPERRHDHGHHADHRHPAAVHELRRVVGARLLVGAGPRPQRPHASLRLSAGRVPAVPPQVVSSAVGKGEGMGTQVSVVMPAYNEADNLAELVPETTAALRDAGVTFEVVVVDDGSTDGTAELMRQLDGGPVVSVRLRRNLGKSAALSVGLSRASGEYVVLMDADGQDDPRQIPKLLAALEGDEDLDLVTGRRAVRHDRFVKRTTSRVYNRVTSMVTGVPGRDFNSGFKAMRRELATSLELYGELHRYIPVLAQWRGFKV